MEYSVKQNKGKIIFLSLILIVTIIGITRYISSTSHFNTTCDKIYNSHEQLCKQLPEIIQKAHKDSVTVDIDALMATMQANTDRVSTMLQMQHAEIQEDFSNLMLWVSVLMVIFLVFSIYSMYKIDELVSQSRESVAQVSKMASEAEQKINEIDRKFNDESEKLKTQSGNEIESLKRKAEASLQKLDSKITDRIQDAQTKISEDIERYRELLQKEKLTVSERYQELQNSINTFIKFFPEDSNSNKET